MKTTQNAIIRIGKAFAKTALKAGVSSANSVCRIGYYQNKVPDNIEMYRNNERSDKNDK